MSRDRKRELCATTVTLNDEQAFITGVLNAYATVVAYPSGERYDWSWAAVERVVGAGGVFVS